MRCDPTKRLVPADPNSLRLCKEINGYLITAGANLRGADLAGADLSDLYIPNVDWRGANLEGATFQSTRQDGGAPTNESNITRGKFDGARCRETLFPADPLNYLACSFARTDLRKAALPLVSKGFTTTLEQARLHKLRYANYGDLSPTRGERGDGDFVNMFHQNPTIAPGCLWKRNYARRIIWSGSVFRGGRFRRAVFDECEMKLVDFSGCYLVRCVFINCSLRGASFYRAKLRGCRFSNNCNLDGAVFDGPDMTEVPSEGSGAALEIGG
jgi:uncharacterized protein YjbI with pentapeptide repeats